MRETSIDTKTLSIGRKSIDRIQTSPLESPAAFLEMLKLVFGFSGAKAEHDLAEPMICSLVSY